MTDLRALYDQHEGRVSQKWSGYLEAYDAVLSDRRDDALALLEIGVQNGGSLEVWARYFPRARRLVGCDIDPRCGQLTFDDPRITVLVGDAAEDTVAAAVRSAETAYDVIIDDGSHRSDDIIRTLVQLLPLVADGGVYLIEDLHCSYLGSFGGGLHAQRSALSFLRRLVDVVNVEHWGLDPDVDRVLGPLAPGGLTPEFLGALDTVRSIEFLDSLCVITVDRSRATRLGTRIVVGRVADVDPGPLAEAGRPSPRPVESPEAFALDPIGHEDEIRRLRAEIVRLEADVAGVAEDRDILRAQLHRVLTSRSWRLTSALRRVFRLLFR